jgi:hypothetical protein
VISGIRLLLESFLGLMREEGELDAFLPILLSGMGHEIVYAAQKGPRQYGVDITSTGRDVDGKRKLFLWLIKCGKIGRSEWNVGNQAVKQSIDDVETYIRSHRLPQHMRLPIKLVVITNGDYTANIAETAAAYLESWCKRNRAESELVNGSALAAWTEKYLFDENIMPAEAKALLRRALANMNAPELAIDAGRALIEQLLRHADAPAKTANALRKQRMGALRAVRTALSVLQYWGRAEGNLSVPYRVAEFAVLRTWAQYHAEFLLKNKEISQEFTEILLHLTNCAVEYHHKLHPYYLVQNALATRHPENLLVCDVVFSDLGRLGLIGLIFAYLCSQEPSLGLAPFFTAFLDWTEALLTSHPVSSSPCWDYHSTGIHCALLLLCVGGRHAVARKWVERIVLRLGDVAHRHTHWPLTCSFEEALAIRHGVEDVSPEFMQTTTILPIMLLWTAALGIDDAYRFLLEKVIPAVPDASLNLWSSDTGFDELVANPSALHKHGVGEVLRNPPALPADLLKLLSVPLPGVAPMSDAAWYQLRAACIPLLAALHWKLQVPREMVVNHMLAAAADTAGD